MKEQVKQAFYAYFKSLGTRAGKSVQAGDLLVQSVKSNLHHTLKPYYNEAVADLVDEGFLEYKDGQSGQGGSLGSIGGYCITPYGVNNLLNR